MCHVTVQCICFAVYKNPMWLSARNDYTPNNKQFVTFKSAICSCNLKQLCKCQNLTLQFDKSCITVLTRACRRWQPWISDSNVGRKLRWWFTYNVLPFSLVVCMFAGMSLSVLFLWRYVWNNWEGVWSFCIFIRDNIRSKLCPSVSWRPISSQ